MWPLGTDSEIETGGSSAHASVQSHATRYSKKKGERQGTESPREQQRKLDE
eukprot:COSAG06_NODE_3920_length_4768_cov_2.703363_4_plen_51_part_00